MDELQAQLVSIIKEVQGDNSGKRIFAETGNSTTAKNKGYKKSSGNKKSGSSSKSGSVKLTYSTVEAKEGDKCPICGKGIVRKGPYGLFCSEYKTTGCRLKNK